MDIPQLYVFTSTHLYFHYILYISIDIYMEPHKDIYTRTQMQMVITQTNGKPIE